MDIEIAAIVIVLLVVTAFAVIPTGEPKPIEDPASKQLKMPRELLVPSDENEMMMIKSHLESEGIPYHVHNDNFGTLYPGPGNFALNERAIFVDESDYEAASALIREGKQE